MPKIVNLNEERTELHMGSGSVVIRKYVDGIKGGRTLDCDNVSLDTLKAGHVIIRDTVNDTYKPMPLNAAGNSYGTLPEGHKYVGLSTTSIEWAKEGSLVGIITEGEVNDAALPYDFSTIADAFKAAVPTLRFDHD